MRQSLRSPNGKKHSTWYNLSKNICLYQWQLIADIDLLLSYFKALSVKFDLDAQLCRYA
ncbi:hypothetical protein H6F74_28760 [Trichocoleus sp. FACHB-90]|uniref:hypothetical protein n=1 Tax=Cyanophyceae TaxID=3028117 RepID=UPI00168A0BAB|nr:hypothetical protein [Trichocoleus sp. FACHB-90]MBD1930181.1 hypothetical protein [Trichocoleus sp. FACHB-90]